MAAQGASLQALRGEVEALGIKDAVPRSATGVVSSLLRELSRVAGAYEELQKREEQMSQDLLLSQAQLFPLRKENSRLGRENNALHLELIAAQEEGDRKAREASVRAQRTRQEADQAGLTIKALEDRAEGQAAEIDALKGRLRGSLPAAAATAPVPPPAAADPARSDRAARRLAEEARALQLEADALRRERDDLSASNAARDAEIQRLHKLLDAGGKDHGGSVTAAAVRKTSQALSQLGGQVDFLNHELALREAALLEAQAAAERVPDLDAAVAALRDRLAERDAEDAVAQRREAGLREDLDAAGATIAGLRARLAEGGGAGGSRRSSRRSSRGGLPAPSGGSPWRASSPTGSGSCPVSRSCAGWSPSATPRSGWPRPRGTGPPARSRPGPRARPACSSGSARSSASVSRPSRRPMARRDGSSS